MRGNKNTRHGLAIIALALATFEREKIDRGREGGRERERERERLSPRPT